MDDIPQQGPGGGPRHPVNVVEQGDKEHEPPAVHPLRRVDGTVDGKGFVAHPEDQVELFPAGAAVLLQHGQPVEQVPRIDHQRQKKSVQGVESRQQQLYRHKFHRACKDKNTHQQGIHERKPLAAHQKAIGQPQKQKADADRQSVGEGGFQRLAFHQIPSFLHGLWGRSASGARPAVFYFATVWARCQAASGPGPARKGGAGAEKP